MILCLKGTQAWNFFFDFFCRNRNLMVPRACNTRFLKIVFDSAEIFEFLTFPCMLSMRWNRFPVCSACDEISSPYAQCAIKFVPRMVAWIVHVKMFTFYHWLSMRGNSFLVCSACDKIVSAYAQHTHAINFRKWLKNP